jgi:hypothetical protein
MKGTLTLKRDGRIEAALGANISSLIAGHDCLAQLGVLGAPAVIGGYVNAQRIRDFDVGGIVPGDVLVVSHNPCPYLVGRPGPRNGLIYSLRLRDHDLVAYFCGALHTGACLLTWQRPRRPRFL